MAQLTLKQLQRFGLTPDTNLGQHFLIDNNVLGVIERLAELKPEDVCYEPGVGVGVLTDFLARRVRHVHGVETDKRLSDAIAAMQSDLENVTLHWADATQINPEKLTPLPNKMVSNLPYHVAAPIVAEALQHAPSLKTYCVMVQKEVGERFFANEGSKGYNALSVLVRTVAKRTGLHRVARTVFAPPPNVDSVLVAFTRTDNLLVTNRIPAYSAFLKQAFQHRRKTLANNLTRANVCSRTEIVDALSDLQLSASSRPEQLNPEEFVQLFQKISPEAQV